MPGPTPQTDPRSAHVLDYGRDVADIYDVLLPPGVDQPEATALLADLTGDGRLLEVGIGDGRLAVPLAAHGTRVHGIDLSTTMLARLAERDATGSIEAVAGDVLVADLDGPFEVVLLAGNTLNQFLDHGAQIAVLRRMRDLAGEAGAVVLEVQDPSAMHADPAPATRTSPVPGAYGTRLLHETTSVDVVHQLVSISRSVVEPDGTHSTSYEMGRYTWPAEVDLLARAAGLRLHGRYRDWHRSPYGAGAQRHVSIYRPEEATTA